jgi:hypothetical protein
MTPQEFKAWFDGFTEAFTGVPTKAQWARVKERVGEIDGKPVTERIYVDRYLPQYIPQYRPRYWDYGYVTLGGGAGSTTGLTALGQNTAGPLRDGGTEMRDQYRQATSFNSTSAMADLGRADAEALAS